MNWEAQLDDIVKHYVRPIPTFDEWIDTRGYRQYVSQIRNGSAENQARDLHSLYQRYLRETGP